MRVHEGWWVGLALGPWVRVGEKALGLERQADGGSLSGEREEAAVQQGGKNYQGECCLGSDAN